MTGPAHVPLTAAEVSNLIEVSENLAVERAVSAWRDEREQLLAFVGYAASAAAGQHADPLATLRDIEEQARAVLAKATGQ